MWNVLIVLTLIVCSLVFVAHYKNWHKIKEGKLRILSGIYYQQIPISELDSVVLVDKLPEMERSSGFSWMAKEKGVFRDTILKCKVYVFVDDLRQQKIKVVYQDSLQTFINLPDSLQTQKLYAILQMELSKKP